MLHVYIYTDDCEADEAYYHTIPTEGSDNFGLMQAIDTLYAHRGIRRIDIMTQDEWDRL